MKLSELTPIQILGGVLVVNTVLAGGSAQLTDLFGQAMANHILSVCVLGSGICGGFIMNMGGMSSQVRNVLAMPGVEKINVNGQAGATLATIAVDPLQDKIAPTPAAMDRVTATANKAAVILLAALALSAFLPIDPASAQIKRPQITGDVAADTRANLGLNGTAGQAATSPLANILGALDDKVLPDLQYALKLAIAGDSKVTAPCYQAWIDIINKRKVAVTNPDGTPMDLPQPRIITDFEKAIELRNALQPDSDFSIKCAPVVAMVKLDLISFMGKIIAGGAGLATLVPGL